MKIESISDTQIRCTLSREDLANRNINLSELAYATDKAKELFRDMIQQANDEFGFDTENLPLMVEAIPIMPDSIVLIITKVEDPEELDTRFSRFSPGSDTTPSRADLLAQMAGADDIIDLFRKLSEATADKKPASRSSAAKPQAQQTPPVDLLRIFEFYSLNDAIRAAGALKNRFHGDNTLYRFGKDTCYQLVLHQSGQSPEEFNQICNQLSEYAHGEAFTEANEAYFKEHARCIIPQNALDKLAALDN